MPAAQGPWMPNRDVLHGHIALLQVASGGDEVHHEYVYAPRTFLGVTSGKENP